LAGVGVMNIMLIVGHAAHREIGVTQSARRAAPRRHLAILDEAIVLTGAGGARRPARRRLSLLINLCVPSLPSSIPLLAVVLAVAFP